MTLTPRQHIAPKFYPHAEPLENRCLLSTDVILEWNDILLQANANDHALASPEQGGPILTSRAFAIVSVAMYDAYNASERIGDAYQARVPRASNADSDAAVAQAAHDTLGALFPSQRPRFDAALAETLERVPNGRREDQGRAAGASVAGQILAARANDGASTLNDPAYVHNGQLGFHAADPLHPTQGYYAPDAQGVTPFAVRNLDQFAARRLDDSTPAGRAAFLQSQEYTDAYNEVVALGGDGVTTPTERTAEQTLIGTYWGYDGRPGLGTPPRFYNQIVRTLAAQERNTEAENARLFALVNLAMADAGLTSWDDKYEAKFWRPILGVRSGATDGNPQTDGDADWTPLGAPASNPRPGETDFTPPFPAYTSGHATFGAAAFQTLARFYGRDDLGFTVVSDEFNGVTTGSNGQVRPLVPRTFDSLTEAKRENAQSRIYLGIHWRFDATEGIRSGDRVANYIFDHFLRSGRGGHGGPGSSAGEPDSGAPVETSALAGLALAAPPNDLGPSQASVQQNNPVRPEESEPPRAEEVAGQLVLSAAPSDSPNGHTTGADLPSQDLADTDALAGSDAAFALNDY